MNYQESIAWLENTSLYSKKDGLTNMRALMKELGDPQQRLSIVHVAGTNGKGTTCSLLAAMLSCDGKRTGLFTSPHLVDYTERIAFVENGVTVNIAQEEFAALADRVQKAAEAVAEQGEAHPTFFQLLTALAFLAFEAHRVDVVVLEVGVGGRLDATNIITHPLLCAIASISLDHTKVLGDTVEKIAAEKAGIIKPGVPVVVSRNPDSVVEVISQIAAEKDAPCILASEEELRFSEDARGSIVLEPGPAQYPNDMQAVPTHLVGNYQKDNLTAALACAKVLGISPEAACEGLRVCRWPGRMQYLEQNSQADWLLEGAHNPDGARFLSEWVRSHCSGRDVTLVYSALRKKDIAASLHELLKDHAFSRIIFARLQYYGGMDESEFNSFLEAEQAADPRLAGLEVCREEDLVDAMKLAGRKTASDGLIIVAGSLYLVGEVLERCL